MLCPVILSRDRYVAFMGSSQVPLDVFCLIQPSQGADGESEFGGDAMEEDELMSEVEDGPVRWLLVRGALANDGTEREGEGDGGKTTEKAKPQSC